MKYKVTSKRDIIVLANVINGMRDEGRIINPHESLIWLPVIAHKPVDGLGKIIGIDPRCVHDTDNTVTEGEFTYIPINGTGDDYLKEHFGLFKIEQSSLSD